MEDHWARFWGDLLGRMSGPLNFRLLLQPAVALFFGFRDGIKDAHRGAPPYFWTIFTDASQRRFLVRDGWKSVAKVFVVASVIDVIYQLIVLRFIYPGETIAAAFLLAIFPYLMIRGPVNRIAQMTSNRHPSAF